jgi:hypothetical protein
MKGHIRWMSQIFLCIAAAGWGLYAYIDKLNDLTQLRLTIPVLMREVKSIHEENARLQYEIERFESPIHLMELTRLPEYSHLKYPHMGEVVLLPSQAKRGQ